MRLPTPAASTITSSGITRILGQYPVDLRGDEGPPLPPTASQAQIVIRLQIRHLDYSISHLDYSIQLPGLRDAAPQGTCCNAALLFLRDLLKKLQCRAQKGESAWRTERRTIGKSSESPGRWRVWWLGREPARRSWIWEESSLRYYPVRHRPPPPVRLAWPQPAFSETSPVSWTPARSPIHPIHWAPACL